MLREQIRVTRPGGVVSAVACFCHTDGLPHYHGRYPLPGNQRLYELAHKMWQVYRRHVRPGLLQADLSAPNQELMWDFKTAGLENLQINGHLILVSPGDSRIPLAEAAEYAQLRHEIDRERLENIWREYGDELNEAGISTAEYEELMALRAARDDYLQADPARVREVMEVYTDPFLFVKGVKPL